MVFPQSLDGITLLLLTPSIVYDDASSFRKNFPVEKKCDLREKILKGNLWATTELLLTARLDGSHQRITSNPKVCHHVNGNDIKIFFSFGAEKKTELF